MRKRALSIILVCAVFFCMFGLTVPPLCAEETESLLPTEWKGEPLDWTYKEYDVLQREMETYMWFQLIYSVSANCPEWLWRQCNLQNAPSVSDWYGSDGTDGVLKEKYQHITVDEFYQLQNSYNIWDAVEAAEEKLAAMSSIEKEAAKKTIAVYEAVKAKAVELFDKANVKRYGKTETSATAGLRVAEIINDLAALFTHTTHVYDQAVAADAYLASAATATAKATYYYTCLCGAIGTETFEYDEPASDFIIGDATGDGVVNTKDIVLLRRYVANINPETGESSLFAAEGADANGDGNINTKDIVLLRLYVSQIDPTTGKSTVVLGKKS